MMNFVKRYYIIVIYTLITLVKADDYHIIYYGLEQGPNLVSFPIIGESNDIDIFFTPDNSSLITNNDISQSIHTIITEGAFGFLSDSSWNGSLNEISQEKGYWILANEPTNFMLMGQSLNQNLYFLHPGANLISYPFSEPQDAISALSFLASNIYAVIGQNEALLSINGTWWGSLNQFNPGKGYWFIINSHTPFQYNNPVQGNLVITPDDTFDNEENQLFNQSTLQSVYFIESIYISGNENETNIPLEIMCNDTVVGQKYWQENYSDIIAMGSDGFDQTSNYCEQNDLISIQSSEQNIVFHVISGNDNWLPNNFSINILSDAQLGDLNYNDSINVTDIIIMLEYLLGFTESFNNHQLLLSDINQDELINVTDIIINIENILEN